MTPDELADRGDTLHAIATPGEWELAWAYRDCGRCRTEGVIRERDDGTWEDLTGDDIRQIVWLHGHWPEIAAMLRRLATAEADAEKWRERCERIASAGERHMWREHGVLPDGQQVEP